MDNRKKIIIDTDIGDDIDDVFALIAAISADFDIVGITTVFRNTRERARMVKKLLSLYDGEFESIPVYAGFGSAFGEEEMEYPHLCQYTEDLDSPMYAPDSDNPQDAVAFIVESCKKYGKDLTVAAIGPFTNIARVIEADGNALDMADRVVIMGGAFFKQYADWNVMCDPVAARIMFDSLHNLECIGADVTHLLTLDKGLAYAVESYHGDNAAAEYISRLYRLWYDINNEPRFILHDALVMYYIADSSICTMEPAGIEVICDGAAKGVTFNIDAYTKAYMNDYYQNRDMSKKALVASSVDLEKFKKYVSRDIENYFGSKFCE